VKGACDHKINRQQTHKLVGGSFNAQPEAPAVSTNNDLRTKPAPSAGR